MQKINIIITTYNRSNYLEKAIESCLLQDYEYYDIIVVDNASTDDTELIMSKYFVNTKVRYYRNSTNLGMIGNYKKAIYDYVDGDWFIILSDDDYYIDNTYLSAAMKLAEKNHNMCLIHAKRKIHYKNTNTIVEMNKELPEVVDGKWMLLNYTLNEKCNTTFPTVLFKTNIAKPLNMFHVNDIVGSDMIEQMRMLLLGDVGFVDKFAVMYLVHDSNISYNMTIKQYISTIKGIDIVCSDAKDQNIIPINKLKYWRNEIINLYLMGVFRQAYKNKSIDDLNEIKQYIKKYDIKILTNLRKQIIKYYLISKLPFLEHCYNRLLRIHAK